MVKKYLFLMILCFSNQFFAKEIKVEIPDSLEGKNFDYLFERIELVENNKKKQAVYLKYFLSKAKAEKNSEEIVNGYKNYLHYSPDNLKLIYADSMIYAAKKSNNNSLIGSAYLSKGIVFYAQKKYKFALDNYLAADNYISKTDDRYQVFKVKYNIGNIKYYLGFYDEAISLFQECIDYFKEENTRAYLNSLHLMGLCYNKMGNYGLCSQINAMGIREGIRLENSEMKEYFLHSEGINQYFQNNYAAAIKNINIALPSIIENKDFANESVGYFYIGKSFWDLHKPDIGLSYFMKVDQIFENKKYIRPDLLQNYQLIIKYYKTKKELNKQLYYTEKLLEADSILDSRFRYVSTRIRKVYDTKIILKEKQEIEKALNRRKYNDFIYTGVGVLLFIVVLFIAYWHIRNKKMNRLKLEEAMKEKAQTETKDEGRPEYHGIDDISKDTVAYILKQLEKFERDKKFLQKDLDSAQLAVICNCNPKYLSLIIRHYKGKNYTRYIADLRIEYIISLMKSDKVIRKYNNGALADEAGFSSTQRFANAFFAKAGCQTSHFVEQINKISD